MEKVTILKNNMKNLKETINNGLRMYFFVMGNLSGRQQGIQAGHAAIEYQLKYGDTEQYKDFANNHKTFILLDGGGSNDMIEREKELEAYGIKFASFQEPDLNNSISAIAFIVPEDIYGRVTTTTPNIFDLINPDINTQFSMYLKGFRLASN